MAKHGAAGRITGCRQVHCVEIHRQKRQTQRQLQPAVGRRSPRRSRGNVRPSQQRDLNTDLSSTVIPHFIGTTTRRLQWRATKTTGRRDLNIPTYSTMFSVCPFACHTVFTTSPILSFNSATRNRSTVFTETHCLYHDPYR